MSTSISYRLTDICSFDFYSPALTFMSKIFVGTLWIRVTQSKDHFGWGPRSDGPASQRHDDDRNNNLNMAASRCGDDDSEEAWW